MFIDHSGSKQSNIYKTKNKTKIVTRNLETMAFEIRKHLGSNVHMN